ncbi:hypothetical protein A2U01_0058930, partial [Trifolium medium]|nr:hypothetical protein [Trifolium medium]
GIGICEAKWFKGRVKEELKTEETQGVVGIFNEDVCPECLNGVVFVFG